MNDLTTPQLQEHIRQLNMRINHLRQQRDELSEFVKERIESAEAELIELKSLPGVNSDQRRVLRSQSDAYIDVLEKMNQMSEIEL